MNEKTVPSTRFDSFTNAREQRKASHNVPAVRFRADDGSAFPEWEEKKLGDVATIVMGQSPDSKNYHEEPVGKVLVQGNADLKDGKVFPRIWTTESPKSAEPGALLMTVRAPVGALAITDIPVALGRGVCAIEGPSILYYLLSKVETEHYWDKVSAGSTFSAVDSSSVNSLKITLPTPAEQERILSLLSTVDSTVSLCQRKLELLTQAKKALMQCMFPKQGETVPELRFRGFSDTWESRKLGEDIVAIHTGTNLLGSVDNHGIPLLKMGNLRNGDFDLSRLEYLPEDADLDPQNVLQYGDFLFNTRNTLELVGKGATWIMKTGKVTFNSNIARFDLKSDIDTVFFNYLYNTSTVMKQIHARATGTTSVAAIYPKALNSVVYRVPSKDEQEKIGHFFQYIDALIDQARVELEQWQEVKKSLLQQLFV